MSYHQGSVWPLFTGWAALAEYRANQPLAGYQLLMENANLTRAQDLGAHTELLSGDFYVPLGRSTSHQLWSSAMVITPTLRGLFGISIDAATKTITVNPHCCPQAGIQVLRRSLLPHLKVESPGSNLAPAETTHPAASITMDEAGNQDPAVPAILTLLFPPGTGFQTLTVTLTW
jgi:hypothetical protein